MSATVSGAIAKVDHMEPTTPEADDRNPWADEIPVVERLIRTAFHGPLKELDSYLIEIGSMSLGAWFVALHGAAMMFRYRFGEGEIGILVDDVRVTPEMQLVLDDAEALIDAAARADYQGMYDLWRPHVDERADELANLVIVILQSVAAATPHITMKPT